MNKRELSEKFQLYMQYLIQYPEKKGSQSKTTAVLNYCLDQRRPHLFKFVPKLNKSSELTSRAGQLQSWPGRPAKLHFSSITQANRKAREPPCLWRSFARRQYFYYSDARARKKSGAPPQRDLRAFRARRRKNWKTGLRGKDSSSGALGNL